MSRFNAHTGAPDTTFPYDPNYVNSQDANYSEVPVNVPKEYSPPGHNARVLPYRGAEYHGVNPDVSGNPSDLSEDVFDMGHITPEMQKPPDRSTTPVPVRIVSEDSSWEEVHFRTWRQIVNATSQQIAGHNRERKTLTIKNKGTVDLLITDGNNADLNLAYTIEANASQTIAATGAVYAFTSDGSNQPVVVYMEYIVKTTRRNDT